MGGEDQVHDYPTLKAQIEEPMKTFGQFLSGMVHGTKNDNYPKITYLSPTPMSEQMRNWTYEDVREFNQPAFKRCYLSEKKDLLEQKYPEWVASRIEEIGSLHITKENFCMYV